MEPGTQLAHYEIIDQVGKGGMGEVWRARDTKLGREVAIKTLPPEFADDPDRLARFEREARLLASLNHPNIAAIYGIEEHEGSRFLVLELVNGDTLADRLQRGAIPVEESLTLALQIAEALEAAHEKGVIHRDLKPANIKVTLEEKVKVLDFGLAKAFAGEQPDVNLSNSPTLSMQATQHGVILGTAAYMSPEQAEGEAADSRADIWSFGVVLFEMLTGRSPFGGKTVARVLAAVLNSEPEWGGLPQNLHPRIRALLDRLLEKDRKDRLSGISDARVEIQKVLADPEGVIVQDHASQGGVTRRAALGWGIASAVGLGLGGVAGWNTGRRLGPTRMSPVRFFHQLEPAQTIANPTQTPIAISANGRYLCYAVNDGIYVRTIDNTGARRLPESGASPFFSPDGEWVAFQTGGELRKIRIDGESSVPVTDAPMAISGAVWSENTIVFPQGQAMMRVPADGGTAEGIIEPEGNTVAKPQVLPDGRILFTVESGGGTESVIAVQSPGASDRAVLFPGRRAAYVPTGHVVVAVGGGVDQVGELFGRTFDPGTLVFGGPVPVETGVWWDHFALSQNGTLVFVDGSTARTGLLTVARYGSDGLEYPFDFPADHYRGPRVSKDGNRIAVETVSPTGRGSIVVFETAGGASKRSLLGEGSNSRPVWTRDGSQRIAFRSDRGGTPSIWWQPADGSAEAEPLTTAEAGVAHMPESFSPDGTLAFVREELNDWGIWTLSPDGVATEFYDAVSNQFGADFSPDGTWLAYCSSASLNVFVQRYPDGPRQQVGENGATWPVWSGNSRLIHRLSPAGAASPVLMSVDLELEPTVRTLSSTRLVDGFSVLQGYRNFDVDPQGRIVLLVPAEGSAQLPNRIAVHVNWSERLLEEVPQD